VQTCIIFNPTARGEKAATYCARLESLFSHCVSRRTGQAGEARSLAAQAVREGFDTIIAAGGDGTVNEVVNGIGDVPGGFESACFGVLPLGTINVFARELGLPRDLTKAAKVLAARNLKRVDLGRVDYTTSGGPQHRHFIQLAGAGIDSRAIELVSWKLKKKIGPLAYLVAGLKAMKEKHPIITVQGVNVAAGELVLIGNGRFYGGSFPVFPAASLQDGMLDVCVLPRVSWSGLFSIGLGMVTGRLDKVCAALHFTACSVDLSSPSRVILQLDGDNVCELPATISIAPQSLQVIVP
jgi:YegS/Rv2252/BmrU family lipid kinase